MKKTLLFLGLLSLAGTAQAQGPWVRINLTNILTSAPGYRVDQIATVSANQAWAVTRESTNGSTANTFLRTNNPAGTEFFFSDISAVGANASYGTANIAPCGNSITTAIAGNFGTPAGGEILRTTNGGANWTKVLTFTNTTESFLDFVYMFDANRGVAMGDPAGGYFEIYTTLNGGVTWTRVPRANIPPVLNANEYGLVHSYFGMSNGTVWFGGASSADTDPVRVFKSTNFGLNWTASPITTLTGTISRLAFKGNGQDGIAFNTKYDAAGAVTSVNLIKSTNGGATWLPAPYVNTATGSFFAYDVDAVNGNFYSVGQRFPATATAPDFGTSYSTDGITWTNLNNSQGFFALDLIPSGSIDAVGYAGAATDAAGIGGMFKTASTILTPSATRNAALQSTLSVYPNPSASGVFTVNLGSDLKAGATLTVSDALGRTVKTQALNAATVGSKMLNLDLSGEKIGVYTLQIRTEAGIATQKIVIE